VGSDIYPGAVLYSTDAWLRVNEAKARRLPRAMVASLQWIQEHQPVEIAATDPASYRGDDHGSISMHFGIATECTRLMGT
jgi:ABC-type nitrate/sulfonate/bicarbonate transport system substrate-binding protein